jgi:hypothetical protein
VCRQTAVPERPALEQATFSTNILATVFHGVNDIRVDSVPKRLALNHPLALALLFAPTHALPRTARRVRPGSDRSRCGGRESKF